MFVKYERSPNSRAKCMRCDNKIQKGEIRGLYVRFLGRWRKLFYNCEQCCRTNNPSFERVCKLKSGRTWRTRLGEDDQ